MVKNAPHDLRLISFTGNITCFSLVSELLLMLSSSMLNAVSPISSTGWATEVMVG